MDAIRMHCVLLQSITNSYNLIIFCVENKRIKATFKKFDKYAIYYKTISKKYIHFQFYRKTIFKCKKNSHTEKVMKNLTQKVVQYAKLVQYHNLRFCVDDR